VSDVTGAASGLRLEPGREGSIPILTIRHPELEVGPSAPEGMRVLIAGDVWCPDDEALTADPEGVPWAALASFVEGHDVGVVNLEAPISPALPGDPKSGPSLRSHGRAAEALRAGGFTAVSLANNHLRDAGDRGVLDTLDACAAAGLDVVGAGADGRTALMPLVVDVGGFTLGILAVAEREFSIAGPGRPGAAPLEPYSTPVRVRELRSRADAVVVIVHGGNEFYPLPSPRLKTIAHSLVACGASAVVLHHQHVYSGIEVTGGAVIAYGTGNFYFPPRFSGDPRWRRGYAVSLVLGRSGVERFRLLPYRQSDPAPAVLPLTEPEASGVSTELLSLSRTIAADDALAREWARFCARQRTRYLSRILGLTRLERAALQRGLWPFWRLRRAEVPGLLNLFTCEAHRETMIDVLESELAAPRTDPPKEGPR
jgi:poly-gamma-glutamate synthesis protein (capsule biosynthesis protein)